MGKLLGWTLVLVALGVATWFSFKACEPSLHKEQEEVAKAPAAVLHRAEVNVGQADLENIKGAIGSYQAQHGKYPDSLNDLVTSGLLQSLPAGNWQYNSATGEVTGP